MPHHYRGHRAESFAARDVNELVELRARQRTFGGAYTRTALGNLGYALAILKIFDRRFYRIGLLYAILAGILYVISVFRGRHSLHDFADGWQDNPAIIGDAIPTVGQENGRVYGRPFQTAGVFVVAVTVVVAAIEIALLVSILNL